jgi:putative ABC transport system ATP-binding protein
MTDAPALEMTDVRVEAGARAILCLPLLTLPSGAAGLVLGPSGAGKTTLLNVASGLLTPNAGQVRVAGEDIGAMPPARRDRFRGRSIGIVFQAQRLVRALTVRQNLALATTLAGQTPDKARIAALLDRIGLAHRADAKAWTLSVGEAQRAGVARAVVTRPALLLADEPTSALDDANAAAVAELLESEAREAGAALLIVTHDTRLKARLPVVLQLGPGEH